MDGQLFFRALSGHRNTIVVLGAALALLGLVIAITYQSFGANPEMMEVLIKSLPKEFEALMKTQGSLLLGSGPAGYVGIEYRHPIYLVVICSFVIGASSGAVAREIERRTILTSLVRPLPRTLFLASKAAAIVTGSAAIVALGVAGLAVGLTFAGLWDQVTLGPILLASIDALALMLAIAGYSLLISTLTSDGGRASSLAIGVTVLMFFMDFLAGIWDVFEWIGPFSLFHYYDPANVLSTGALRTVDMAVFLSTAVLSLAAAVIIFRRRDIG